MYSVPVQHLSCWTGVNFVLLCIYFYKKIGDHVQHIIANLYCIKRKFVTLLLTHCYALYCLVIKSCIDEKSTLAINCSYVLMAFSMTDKPSSVKYIYIAL